MKSLFTLAVAVVLMSCAPKNYDIDWQLEVPSGDVRFIFLPGVADLANNALALPNSEIEVTLDARSANAKTQLYYSALAQNLDMAGAQVRFKTKLSSMKVVKEIYRSVLDTLPDEVYDSRWGSPNQEKSSRFLSRQMSNGFVALQDQARKMQANTVVISQYTIQFENDESGKANLYRTTIRAVFAVAGRDSQ